MVKETIKNELVNIHNKEGFLTPTLVVKEAEPEDNPLHKYFEWNNDIAGHKHRLWQARMLIRTVVIESIDNEQKKEHVFWHTKNIEGEPLYQTKEVLFQEPDKLETALSLAKERVAGASRAVNELLEISKGKAIKVREKGFERASKLIDKAQEFLI